jgi:hypothetical protein
LQDISLKGINDYLSYSLYFLITIFLFNQGNVKRQNRVRVYLILFFVILFLQLIVVVILHRGNRGVLGSILGHANTANLFLAYLSVYYANRRKWIITGCILLMMVVIGGRTSLISAGVVATCIFISANVRFAIIRKGFISVMLLLGIAMFGFLVYKGIYSEWNESIGLPFMGDKGGRFISLGSMKWRILHWSHYLQDIDQLKFILIGNGIGAHAPVSIPIYGQFYEVHNDFLKIFYDFGLIGLSLFVLADINIGRFFLSQNKGNWTLVFYLYYIRYTYMFFDNTVTNFMDTFIFLYFIYLFSNKNLLIADER